MKGLGKRLFPTDKVPAVAVLVGGGGKSALMYAAADDLAARGARVLVTTTTHIYHPRIRDRHHHRFLLGGVRELLRREDAPRGSITVAAPGLDKEGARLTGFEPGEIDLIQRSGLFDFILVEADGSRGRPLKAPGENEPVVPSTAEIIIGVIGLDCLGQPAAEEWVHRPEIFCRLTGAVPGEPVGEEHLLRLILSPDGLFKGTPRDARRLLVLNKCEGRHREEGAKRLAALLGQSGWNHPAAASILEGERFVMDIKNARETGRKEYGNGDI